MAHALLFPVLAAAGPRLLFGMGALAGGGILTGFLSKMHDKRDLTDDVIKAQASGAMEPWVDNRPWRHCVRPDGTISDLNLNTTQYIIVDMANALNAGITNFTALHGLYNIPWLETWADAATQGNSAPTLQARKTSALQAKTEAVIDELVKAAEAVDKEGRAQMSADASPPLSPAAPRTLAGLESRYRSVLDIAAGVYSLSLNNSVPSILCPPAPRASPIYSDEDIEQLQDLMRWEDSRWRNNDPDDEEF